MRTFREFCEQALYHPRTGFYSRRKPSEHFYTAPELHPGFGWTLARAVARKLERLRRLDVPGPYAVVEMGSASGLLGRHIQEGLRREAPEMAAEILWVAVERSRDHLLESLSALQGSGAKVLGYQRLSDVPPLRGVFLSNELVDALPFHVLEKRDGKVGELYADDSGNSQVGALSQPELEPIAQGIEATLAEGQRHAVCLEAVSWLKTAGQRLAAGWLITIDYGKRFGPRDINAPRSYRRHVLDDRIIADPGRRDLTAPVDFSVLIGEGEKLGLSCEAFTSLSSFLLDHGLMDWLPRGDGAAAISGRAKLKTLIHPEGMGEAFKVLVQAKAAAA
ncbi:MAG TPA: hypothetical protein DEB40_08335 [Elusimicrobia bacterium]|nr:hypothetical protein [Elusimicrobiota bacterium]HBT61737.1 hypothetical protein [Elusimicrobiota bacterium]